MAVWKVRGVESYRWISIIDNLTSPICRGRSNKIFTVGEGPLPPAHYNCRSSIAPYRSGDEVPESYGTWLRKQPREVIDDILGKTKAKMYLAGELPLDKFTVANGRELTIKEIKARAKS